MIDLNVKDENGSVKCISSMYGSGLEIKNEITYAPAALLEQFVSCLKKNGVPAVVIRRQLTEVIEKMTENIKECAFTLVKEGEL